MRGPWAKLGRSHLQIMNLSETLQKQTTDHLISQLTKGLLQPLTCHSTPQEVLGGCSHTASTAGFGAGGDSGPAFFLILISQLPVFVHLPLVPLCHGAVSSATITVQANMECRDCGREFVEDLRNLSFPFQF